MSAPGTKTATRIKQAGEKVTEACKISVIVDNEKKLGGFVFRQMEAELNRILRTGGANIQVKMVTSGRADYALRVRDFAPKNNVQGDILGLTSKEDPHNSFLFVETIEDVWRQRGSLPRGGRGIVYARVYAHELATHGLLGWAHSQAGDKDMGFLGSGKNWSDFLFNNEDVVAIRTQQWKYVDQTYYRGGTVIFGNRQYKQLYSADDIHESYSVAATHPDVTAEMQHRLEQARAKYAPFKKGVPPFFQRQRQQPEHKQD